MRRHRRRRDVISREVVEPGTEGLAKLVDAFGSQILRAHGALNRPALAAIAFSDDDKRQTLNGIVHPLVAHRRSDLIAAAGRGRRDRRGHPAAGGIQMAPMFPLVVVVNADPEVRVRRLIEYRGFTEADARARIAAQATEEQRRGVADVWLDNSGSEARWSNWRARDLWYQRILPFAHNVATRTPAAHRRRHRFPADPTWAQPGRSDRQPAEHRLRASRPADRPHRFHRGAGHGRQGCHRHPGHGRTLEVADELADGAAAGGLSRGSNTITTDVPKPDARSTDGRLRPCGPVLWHKPGFAPRRSRPADQHPHQVRLDGPKPAVRAGCCSPTGLTANPAVQERLSGRPSGPAGGRPTRSRRVCAGQGTLVPDAHRRAWAWADATDWRPRRVRRRLGGRAVPAGGRRGRANGGRAPRT